LSAGPREHGLFLSILIALAMATKEDATDADDGHNAEETHRKQGDMGCGRGRKGLSGRRGDAARGSLPEAIWSTGIRSDVAQPSRRSRQ